MNMNSLTLKVLMMVTFFSCNAKQQEQTNENNSGKISSTNCYRYIKNNDTIQLKINEENGIVKGTLMYNLYEKDKNIGTIEGRMNGLILIADYSFFSEGVKSVRQVAFKKSGSTFLEGFGESDDKNGKMIFKNMDSLDFTHPLTLNSYDCE